MQDVRNQLPPKNREVLSAWERESSPFTTGFEEGHEAGLREGREEGREEGLQRGLRAAILTVLGSRGFELDEQTQARLLACDRAQLEAIVARAATITSLAELLPEGS